MATDKERPVHIRDPDRARPPGHAGEAIVSDFRDMALELSRLSSAEAARSDGGSRRACAVDVSETAYGYRIVLRTGARDLAVDVADGLFHVHGLKDASEGGAAVSRSFTVPGDLEMDLVKFTVSNEGDLDILLPRTAETTRAVRQLEASSS